MMNGVRCEMQSATLVCVTSDTWVRCMPMRGTGTTALKIVVNVLVGVAVGLGAMTLAKHQIAPQHNPWHCAVGFRRHSHRPVLAAEQLQRSANMQRTVQLYSKTANGSAQRISCNG